MHHQRRKAPRKGYYLEALVVAVLVLLWGATVAHFRNREAALVRELASQRAALLHVDDRPTRADAALLTFDSPLFAGGSEEARGLGSSPPVAGVAVVCCLDGPGWMQKRYTMSVMNILAGLPPTFKVQLFHHGSTQSLKGLANSPGIARLIATGRVLVTLINDVHKKRSRSELYLSTYFWNTVMAEQVLFFGHGGALCHNSQLEISNFTGSFDLVASPDGGYVLLKRSNVLSWLRSVLPEGSDFIPKVHGPITYLVGNLRKLPGVRAAPTEVTDRFVLVSRSDFGPDDAIPWAISGTLSTLKPEARKAAIERCPEIKMVFPSLDNPSCFGAGSTLDKDACISSLCVSKPKPGGC